MSAAARGVIAHPRLPCVDWRHRTVWLTTVDSLQKQEGRHRFLSCYLAISMNIKTAKNSEKQRSAPLFFAGRACPQARISAENEATLAVNFWEEQRKTEKRAALFRGPRLPPSQDFSGERGDARCKFLGRTAKTAAEPVTLLHVETMLGAAEATRPNIGGIFCGGGDQQRAKHRPQVSSNPRRQRRRLPPAVLSRRRRLRPIRSVRR